MSALDTVKALVPARYRPGRHQVSRATLTDYWSWVKQSMQFGGHTYGISQNGVTTSYGKTPAEPIGNSYEGYAVGLLQADGPVAAVEAFRLRVFAQAPPLFQTRQDNGRPGDLFDDEALDLLREPWTGGTFSDLMKRALIHGDLGGNAYIVELDGELVLLRPDWTEIVLTPRTFEGRQVGFKQVGIAYYEGGSNTASPAIFMLGEYAHFVPNMPDPLASYRGMSWLTPVIREIQADRAATDHGVKFFENAATPNLAVSLPKELTPAQFNDFVDKMQARTKGVEHAYETLYTGGGADVTVIGTNMQQMNMSGIQGKLETRIANAGGVPPTLVNFSEGMQGSSLNAGNYTPAKRSFVDTTGRDLWSNWYGSMQTLIKAPGPRDKLTYDPRDIPFLHEDQKDVAEIKQIEASTMNTLVTAGWEKESIITAVIAGDWSLLKDTGLVSVQLLPPGTTGEPTDGPSGDQSAPPDDAGRSRTIPDDVDDFDDLGDDPDPEVTAALLEALEAFINGTDVGRHLDPLSGLFLARAWNPALHPRGPDGRFISLNAHMLDRLHLWAAKGGTTGKNNPNPLLGFNRNQLRRIARQRGITLQKNETEHSIAIKIMDDVSFAQAAAAGDAAEKAVKDKKIFGTPLPKALTDAALPVQKVPKAAPPPVKSASAIVESGDFSQLKRISGPAGANPGGIYEAPDGTRWYIKQQRTAQHGQNEAMASALYAATGVYTPRVITGTGAPELTGEHQTATRFLEGAKVDLRARVDSGDEDYLDKIRLGFAQDAWLANWDVAGENPEGGWDNIVSNASGNPVRIDNGGALLFRGLGGEKGSAFGHVVTEWEKFRDPNSTRASAAIFKDMTPEQAHESAAFLDKLKPSEIRQIVATHGGSPDLADKLVARRDDILSRVKAEKQALAHAKAVAAVKAEGSQPSFGPPQWGTVKSAGLKVGDVAIYHGKTRKSPNANGVRIRIANYQYGGYSFVDPDTGENLHLAGGTAARYWLSTPSGKPSAEQLAKRFETGVSGKAALNKAPVKAGPTMELTLMEGGLPAADAASSRAAFDLYQDGEFSAINKTLLNAKGDQSQIDDTHVASFIGGMDAAMKLSELTDDVIIYRGERAPARSFPPGTWSMIGGMEGAEWTFHGFGSSSANNGIARNFAQGSTSAPQEQRQPTVMRILVPKGTRAVAIRNGTLESEQELILDRGLRYRVVKDHGVVLNGVREIDVVVIS